MAMPPANDSSSGNPESEKAAGPIAAEPTCPASIPAYGFEKLAGNSCVVHITFAGTTYQLRRTRAGKLVLNK